MNRFLASSAMTLLATATLTVTVPVANAMPYEPPQLAASSQLSLVDDDDRRSIGRYRGGDDGWSRFRGDSRDDDDDNDNDD